MAKRVDVGGMNDGATANAGTATATFVGASVGDAAVVYAGTNSGTDTCTTPSGWTVIAGPFTLAANTRGYLFGKTALTQTEITNGVGFVWSGTGRLTGSGMVLIGSVQGWATATEAQATASSVTNAANTTSGAFNDCLIFDHARIATASTHPVATFPAAWTKGSERSTNFGTSPNYSSACGILTTPVAAGTSIGGGSTTTSPAATHIIGIIVECLAYPAVAGAASARGDSSGASTSTVAAAGDVSARADSTGASTGQAVAAGAATASAGASGASASTVAAAGSGAASSAASGATFASVQGAGAGSGKGNGAGASFATVQAASTPSGISIAAGAATSTIAAAGAASARADAAGDSTIPTGAFGTGAASATGTAGGSATVTTMAAGSGQARGSAGGASVASTTAAGAGSARASAAGVAVYLQTATGSASARASVIFAPAFVTVRPVGAAAARSSAAGVAAVVPPRDLKVTVELLDPRWGVTQLTGRWDAETVDQWGTRLLEDV